MNCLSKACFLFLVLVLLIGTPHLLFSANILYKMQIGPLNRLVLFFDEIPKEVDSQLDNTKTNITIKLKDAIARVKSDTLLGEGIINKVSIQRSSTNIDLSISLKSPRGYTITPLEYSRALVVEVFDWNSLSPPEDNYRMGQLALMDNLASARLYFEKAFSENIANAGYYLGMIYLKANEVQKAKEIFLKAQTLGTDIVDNYAALAQVCQALGDSNKFQEYRKKFISNTVSLSYNPIEIDSTLRDSIFKSVNDFFPLVESQSTDTLTDGKKEIPQEKQISNTNYGNESETGSTISLFYKVLIFLVGTVILMSIMLVTLYLRWKKQRTKQMNEKFASEFQSEQEKIHSYSGVAIKLYQKAEESKTEISTQENLPPNPINQHIRQLAEEILATKQKIELEEVQQEPTPSPSSTKQKISPRLAMQIQHEQEELIRRKLLQLANIPLENSQEKMLEISKRLGIPMSSLFAKKNIEAMSKDKSIIEKLRLKFSSKKKQ